MKVPTLGLARSIGDLLDRRAFLGSAGAASLGAALATLGAPESARAFGPVPPPANFTTLLGVCTGGTGTGTHTPGVTNTLRPIHIDATVTFSTACAVAQNKTVTGLTYSLDTISSCSQKTDASGTGTIVYRTGQSSSWTLDSWTATRLLGQIVAVDSGLITNGPFNGARLWHFFIRTVNEPSLCASAGGVISATGTDTLIIAE